MDEQPKSLFDETIRDLLDKSGPGPGGGMVVSKLEASGADTLAAIIIIVGDDRVGEVVDAVGQLPIWTEDTESRAWVDECDRVVFVAAVRALGKYGVFARGVEDGDVELLSRRIPMGKTRMEVQQALDAYAKKKNWIHVPSPASLCVLLGAVMNQAPGEQDLAEWSDLERAQAAIWAVATQLKDTSDRIAIPPVPNCLAMFFRKAG